MTNKKCNDIIYSSFFFKLKALRIPIFFFFSFNTKPGHHSIAKSMGPNTIIIPSKLKVGCFAFCLCNQQAVTGLNQQFVTFNKRICQFSVQNAVKHPQQSGLQKRHTKFYILTSDVRDSNAVKQHCHLRLGNLLYQFITIQALRSLCLPFTQSKEPP